jgi:hypothetical protein
MIADSSDRARKNHRVGWRSELPQLRKSSQVPGHRVHANNAARLRLRTLGEPGTGASSGRSWIGRSASPGRIRARYSPTGSFSPRRFRPTHLGRIAAMFGPAYKLPMWVRFLRPRATGRIEFSARLPAAGWHVFAIGRADCARGVQNCDLLGLKPLRVLLFRGSF